MRFTPVIAAALLMPLAAQAQIYKCPDAGGGTVIQQIPCAGGQALDIHPASGAADSDAATAAVTRSKNRIAEIDQRARIRAAINRHEPIIGMTIEEVQRAMGAPARVNSGNYQGTQRDQAIWDRPDGTWYVYTKNGIVTDIQREDPIRSHAQAPCPTTTEMRNARVSANALSATDGDTARYESLLRQQRECGR